jgi:hypothetical protein
VLLIKIYYISIFLISDDLKVKDVAMQRLVLLVVLLATITSFAANTRIPIPENSAPVEDDFIIVDPKTGEQIVCNQILMIFKTGVIQKEQEFILASIPGKIIGGIPSMQIYQILIENPGCTVDKIKQICDKVLQDEPFQKIDADALVKRKSNLDIEPTERLNISDNSNSIEYTLNLHRNTLTTCQKQIRQNFPQSHGEILFRIYLSPSGEVTKVKTLKSDLKNDKIINCFEYKIGCWNEFPKEPQKYERQFEFSLTY